MPYTTKTSIKNWHRPTLPPHHKVVPLALKRLTAVFGMGTGISASLWTPVKFTILFFRYFLFKHLYVFFIILNISKSVNRF